MEPPPEPRVTGAGETISKNHFSNSSKLPPTPTSSTIPTA
ncbi:hypothetical protein A2U01_0044906 [Trifolium medium]|uniref:Uncharacterized protein n=1 Tax=Trifolium medium TaxID=97028 RepID=A0A392QIK5_9FABA|nr:hypothetical protein [Trifolium medium]